MAKKLATNVDCLVEQSVIGAISSPVFRDSVYRITTKGKPVVLPGVGGISYNVLVGDSATRWQADHVEPGVSVKNSDGSANGALNTLSCVGNTATLVSGEAKGSKGVVTGKHGGIEHVLVDFAPSVLERLVIGDRVQVRAAGQGMTLTDYPHIKAMNVCEQFLQRMGLTPGGKPGTLKCPVARLIPAAIMGSGLGRDSCQRGDYDIQLFDPETIAEYKLDELRLGDIVAILDADHSYGRILLKGAVSIGIVVHSICVVAGHGPGVTTLLTSPDGALEPVLRKGANIAQMLRIGRSRSTRKKRR